MLRALHAADVEALGGPELSRLDADDWVPFLMHARLLAAIDRIFGAGDLALLRDVGRFMAQTGMPNVFRPLMRLLTPGFFLSMSMRLWRRYHTHGTWEVVRTSHDVRAVLVDHPVAHEAFCATFVGWVEGALAFAGARNPVVEITSCVARGDRACAVHGTFAEAGRGSSRDRLPIAPN